MEQNPDVVRALAAAAAEINRPTTLPETLQAIVDVARNSMPDIEHVGITLPQRSDDLLTDAATDPLVHVLDQIQYELREGPCVEALRDDDQPVVVAEHLRHESRWHDFVVRAVPHGVRAVLAVRLRTGDTTIGVLNMYSTSTDTIGDETRSMAELFALHAAYAYGHARTIGNLEAALESRAMIGNAVGVVMERYGLTSERAFEYLVRTSATSETKLRDVARELLQQTAVDPQPGEPSPQT